MDYVASRAFSHEGKHYPQGAAVKVSDGLAAEWQAAGLIEPVPAKAEPEAKAKAKP